uniref:Uncharacterized protein n=1 Tax=Anguilla anguilla TaxID=7936 RepID=A0A0E9W7H0_ANGAN
MEVFFFSPERFHTVSKVWMFTNASGMIKEKKKKDEGRYAAWQQ